jgi:predicted metal-binding protein
MTREPKRDTPAGADLIRLAHEAGATAAAVITAESIVLSEDLAALCHPDACERYGQAPSCPPVIRGPEDFRERFAGFDAALVIRIDVPTEILLSSQRREVMGLLHEVAAAVERSAAALGWPAASALAGGSCKYLFCHQEKDCPVLAGAGGCRHPDTARPSMSGFGIDVTRLMESAGWTMRRAGDAETSVAPVVALVMLG